MSTISKHHKLQVYAVILLMLWVSSHCYINMITLFDGCTKCPFEFDYQRWILVKQISLIYIIQFIIDMLLFYTAYFLFFRHSTQRPSRNLTITCLQFYTISFVDSWGSDIHNVLRCGHDCLPEDALTKYTYYFGYLKYISTCVFYVLIAIIYKRNIKSYIKNYKTIG